MTAAIATDALHARLAAIYADALGRVDAEVSAYPQPIPACDAQFNHLLEQRRRLRRARRALDEAPRSDASALHRQALATRDWLDAPARRALEEALDG